jgi:membrane protease YdiL (CAAX protease family)
MAWLAVLEALVLAAILALSIAGVKPFAGGMLLFVLPIAWLSLRRRGLRWRDVGLRIPPRWPRMAAIGLAGGVIMQAVLSLLVDPLLKSAGLEPAHAEGVSRLASGGVVSLLATLVAVWIIGGVLEEMTFRGYMLSRIRGTAPGRAVVAILVSSAYFGLCHWYQGPSGVIDAAIHGAVNGTAYVLTGYNLFVPILLHAAFDTAGVLLMAAGLAQ